MTLLKLSIMILITGGYVRVRPVRLLAIELSDIPSLDQFACVSLYSAKATSVVYWSVTRAIGLWLIMAPKKIIRELIWVRLLVKVGLRCIKSVDLTQLLFAKDRAYFLGIYIFVRLSWLLNIIILSFFSLWSDFFGLCHYGNRLILVVFTSLIQVFFKVGLIIVAVCWELLSLRGIVNRSGCCFLGCHLWLVNTSSAMGEIRTFHNFRVKLLIDDRWNSRIPMEIHTLTHYNRLFVLALRWLQWNISRIGHLAIHLSISGYCCVVSRIGGRSRIRISWIPRHHSSLHYFITLI